MIAATLVDQSFCRRALSMLITGDGYSDL